MAHVQTDFKREDIAVGNDWFGKQLLPPVIESQSSQKFQKRFWNANVASSAIGFAEAY